MEPRTELINPAPVVHRRKTLARGAALRTSRTHAEADEEARDGFDAEEVPTPSLVTNPILLPLPRTHAL